GGALPVGTATVGERTARQRDALRAVASWAADRLRHAEQPRVPPQPRGAPDAAEPPPGAPHAPEPPGTPELPTETGFRQAFSANQVGAWVWYIAPGVLHLDEPAMALLGIDPEAYDGRIQTWLRLVHPHDVSWGTAPADNAGATLPPHDAEDRG